MVYAENVHTYDTIYTGHKKQHISQQVGTVKTLEPKYAKIILNIGGTSYYKMFSCRNATAYLL